MNLKEVIKLESIIGRKPGFVTSEIDGEIVMMSIEQGSYFGLDDIGSRIWEIIEKPTSVYSVCQTLANEFNVDEATCQEDVLEFARKLFYFKIITVEQEGA